MKTPTELVFVYGTLRRGGSNHSRMDGCTHITHAIIRGHLYRIDWYPGLVLDEEKGTDVAGEVYEVPVDMMDSLDEYEGSGYRRVKRKVRNQSGEEFEVWVWEWTQSTEGLQLVPNGDWLALAKA